MARAAGVSRSVVSRAFTEGAPVAPETRAAIQRIAARLGYAPNLLARGLLTGRSNLVAVVVNTVSDLWDTFFFDKLFQALQSVAVFGKPDLHGLSAIRIQPNLFGAAACLAQQLLVRQADIDPELKDDWGVPSIPGAPA